MTKSFTHTAIIFFVSTFIAYVHFVFSRQNFLYFCTCTNFKKCTCTKDKIIGHATWLLTGWYRPSYVYLCCGGQIQEVFCLTWEYDRVICTWRLLRTMDTFNRLELNRSQPCSTLQNRWIMIIKGYNNNAKAIMLSADDREYRKADTLL
jgi:hypothetical protein